MIELYHCPFGRSFRNVWLLEEMGLPYKLHVLPFPPRLLAPDYLQINPLGTIPFLIDGTTRLSESAAILEYLPVRYGPSDLAVAPGEAAYGAWLNWLHFGEASLTAPQAVALVHSLFLPEEARVPAVAADFTQRFLDKLPHVEAALQGKAFLCAGRFTSADICVGYALMLCRYIGVADRLAPVVQSYWQSLQARAGFKAALAAQSSAG